MLLNNLTVSRSNPNTHSNPYNTAPKYYPSPRHAMEVLIIEDSEMDAERTVDLLHELKMPMLIRKILDGSVALNFLSRANTIRTKIPDVILLDLHLPVTDGFEILAKIETLPRLHNVPIIIMSDKKHYNYIKSCYENLRIVDFISKPFTKKALEKTFKLITTRFN